MSRREVRLLRAAEGLDSRIDSLQRLCVTQPGVLSLAGGLPAAQTFPLGALARALAGAGRDALQYDWPEGRQAIREFVAARLQRRGANVEADEVLITSGAQQALDIAVQLVGRAGRAIRVPPACYPGALELCAARGIALVADGGPADLTYAMPVVSNPTGLALPQEARSALLAGSGLIIEDDAYADLRFDGRTPPPLFASAPERVFYVGTFSKTLCPGLRVGWLVPPRRCRRSARYAKRVIDLQANTLAQRVVEGYLASEDFDERLAWLRGFYAHRAERLVSALRRHLRSFSFREPEGGFSIWATSEETGDDVEFLATALRLAFSSIEPDSVDEAVRRLARAFHAFVRARRSGAE